jgi:hypothetical protein
MTRYTLSDIEGMIKRLNNTIVKDGFGASDIRYSLEHTQGKLYSINEIDIMDALPKGERIKPIGQTPIKKTLCMNTLDNIYSILYAMCNTLDNLRYMDGRYRL